MYTHIESFQIEEIIHVYRKELLEKVVPFWINHAIDWNYGGIFSCISDQVDIQSRDKYRWSQLRALYCFSALLNKIEKRKEWLEIANHIYNFIKTFARDRSNNWCYVLRQDGSAVNTKTNIYSNAFAINALLEFAKATNNLEAKKLALTAYYHTKDQLFSQNKLNSDPLKVLLRYKAQGIAMIFENAFYELGRYLNNRKIMKEGLLYAEDIKRNFLRQGDYIIYEFITDNNAFKNSAPGCTIVPGYALYREFTDSWDILS